MTADKPMPSPLDPIRFTFDESKAAAAAALLLKLEGGCMNYMRLIKLLYLADRESLSRLGRPISGDRFYAMKHGPVLSRVLDLIKHGGLQPPEARGPWTSHIEREGYAVRLKVDPGVGRLSDAEVEILSAASKLFGSLDQWHLRDITHSLPEWHDSGDTSAEILPEDILRALEKPEEEIEEVRQVALEKAYFDSIFGS